MAASTKDDRKKGTGRPNQDKPLTSAQQAEFDQLAARLRDTPSGDSDQAYSAPSNNVYDEEQPGYGSSRTQTQGLENPNPNVQRGGFGMPAGSAPSPTIQRGGFGSTKKEMSPDDIKDREQSESETGQSDDPNKLGKGYTQPEDNEKEEDQEGGRFKRGGRRVWDFVKKRKKFVIFGGAATSMTVSGWILMLTLLPFQLPHILNNIDFNVFGRIHRISLGSRSNEWIKAYMMARLMDIEDPANNNKASDNIMFRADRVDYGKPFTDWYRTMRASKFEAEMFEQHGIKFTSMAVREGNRYVFRAARIVINDKVALEFDLRSAGVDESVIERALNGDISAYEEIDRLTGRLDDFIEREVFDSSKQARQEVKDTIKRAMDANGVKWWNAMKRYHIRKDIMNMTGIGSWKFFEETRGKLNDKYVDLRNQVIQKAINKMLPQNSKSGKLIECMLGITSCRASPDPSSPDNRNLPPTGDRRTGETDPNGNPIGDGEGAERLEAGLPGEDVQLSDTAQKIAKSILEKGGLVLSVISVLDSLSKFDESVINRSISTMVFIARMQQVAGIYSVTKIANDNARAGTNTAEEYNAFMPLFANVTNNEGWATVIENRPNIVHAAELIPASTKEEYCSLEHQLELRKPENLKAANNEYVYNCPAEQIGAATLASALEESWNQGIGGALHGVLQIFRNTIGFALDIYGDIADFIMGPINAAVMALMGNVFDVKDFIARVGAEVLEFSGAGPMFDEVDVQATPGKIMNLVIQGGAATAEAAMRGQGGALSTPQTEADSRKLWELTLREDQRNMTFHTRYLSLDNPHSIASKSLFALVNRSPGSIGQTVLGSIGSLFTTPLAVITNTVHAADIADPYTAAKKLAAIPTYDHPEAACLKRPVIGKAPPKIKEGVWGQNGDGLSDPMTPQNATNADNPDGGNFFTPEELNWDLLRDKDRWYAALYEKAGDDQERRKKVLDVWNCALLDNATAGSLGGLYGYKGVGAVSSSNEVRD